MMMMMMMMSADEKPVRAMRATRSAQLFSVALVENVTTGAGRDCDLRLSLCPPGQQAPRCV